MSGLILPNLISDDLAGGTDFVIAEWTAPAVAPGTREPMAPVHVHRNDDEAWYVLEGALGFSFDGHDEVVGAGGGALAPAGAAHTYWAAGDVETRYLIVMPPRLRELIAVLHDADRRAGRSTEEVFAAYDSYIVDPEARRGVGGTG